MFDLLDIDTFEDAGVYDDDDHRRRNEYTFDTAQWASIQSGIGASIAGSGWKEVARGELDFLGLVNKEELVNWIIGGQWLQVIQECLKALGKNTFLIRFLLFSIVT